MENKYKDFPHVTEENKETIDLILEKIQGKSYYEIKSMFKLIKHFVKESPISINKLSSS